MCGCVHGYRSNRSWTVVLSWYNNVYVRRTSEDLIPDNNGRRGGLGTDREVSAILPSPDNTTCSWTQGKPAELLPLLSPKDNQRGLSLCCLARSRKRSACAAATNENAITTNHLLEFRAYPSGSNREIKAEIVGSLDQFFAKSALHLRLKSQNNIH